MQVRVIDDGGKTMIEGRDLATIREHLGENQTRAAAPPLQPSAWHKDGITRWDFGPLPEHVDLKRGGLTLTKYPALVDAGPAAGLRLCDSLAEALRLTRRGILTLFVLAEHRELKTQIQWLPQVERVRLFAAPLCTKRPVDHELINFLASRALCGAIEIPRDANSFEALRLAGRRNVAPAAQELAKFLPALFVAYHDVRLALERPHPAIWQPVLVDVLQQLQTLLAEGFLLDTPWPWLIQFPRYLRAISSRIRKLATDGVARDRQHQAAIAPRQDLLLRRIDPQRWASIDEPELATYRWMLEELRVSLFAQELGTSLPVSPHRLDKQWNVCSSSSVIL
jgi:ATP-dependent helicase HrpA